MNFSLKKSRFWIICAVAAFAVNALSLLISRAALGISLDAATVGSSLTLSALAGGIVFLGYLGLPRLSMTFAASNIAAVAYVIYISLSIVHEGWSDLTTITGYLVILAIGAAVGVAIELAFLLVHRFRRM